MFISVCVHRFKIPSVQIPFGIYLHLNNGAREVGAIIFTSTCEAATSAIFSIRWIKQLVFLEKL